MKEHMHTLIKMASWAHTHTQKKGYNISVKLLNSFCSVWLDIKTITKETNTKQNVETKW